MRTDRARLEDAIEAIDRCLAQAERGSDAFEADELLQVWMVHHLEILGEACRSASDPVRAEHPDVPWAAIVGMRNVLVHDYFGIDLGEVHHRARSTGPPLSTCRNCRDSRRRVPQNGHPAASSAATMRGRSAFSAMSVVWLPPVHCRSGTIHEPSALRVAI